MAQNFDDPLTQRLYTFHREAFYKIRPILPPPFEPTPQGYAERDQAVIEAIVQLVPVNAAETELAAMAVAGNQLWMHYMREARRNQDNAREHDRLTAQASRTGRDARGYLAALERSQNTRTRREATRAGAEQAEIIEMNSRRLMLTAMADPPKGMQPPPAEPAAATAAAPVDPTPDSSRASPPADAAAASPPAAPLPAAPETAAGRDETAADAAAASAAPAPAELLQLTPVARFVPPPAKPGRARQRDDDGEPKMDWAAEAEFYAKVYPDRARLFRKFGRLPRNCDFGPPEPKLLRAIIAGSTPELMSLDAPDPAADERLRRYA